MFLPLLLFGGRMQTYDNKAQVYRGPIFDSTDNYNFHIDSVIVTKDTTYVFCCYYAEDNSWANISDSTYLEDVESKEKYYILKSVDLPYAPQKYVFTESGNYLVSFLFPSIKEVRKFNFIENDTSKAFNIYNVDLNNCTNSRFDDIDLDQLTQLKDSFIYANDTLKSILTMEIISSARGYYFGYKSSDFLESLLEKSGLYHTFGYYAETIELIDGIIQFYPEIVDNKNIELGLLLEKAKIQAKLNENEDAISTCNQYFSIFKSIDDEKKDWGHYVLAIAQLAVLYLDRGNYSEAAEYFEESIDICNKHELYDNYMSYLHCLCLCYSELEKYDDAINIVNREDDAKIDSLMKYDESSYLYLMRLISKDYMIIDELEKSKFCKDRVQEIFNGRSDGDEKWTLFMQEWTNQFQLDAHAISDHCFEKGMEYYKDGKYENAISYFARSIDYFQEAGMNDIFHNYELLWIANCYFKLGDEENARKISSHYKLTPLNRFEFYEADSILCLSDNLFKEDSINLAIEKLREGLSIGEKLGGKGRFWMTCRLPDFVKICIDKEMIDEALELCLLNSEIQKEFFEASSKNCLLCNLDLFALYKKKNDYLNAIKIGAELIPIIKVSKNVSESVYPSVLSQIAFCMSKQYGNSFSNRIRDYIHEAQKASNNLYTRDKEGFITVYEMALYAAENIKDRDLIIEICDSMLPLLRTNYQISDNIRNTYFYVLDCLFFNYSHNGETVELALDFIEELKSASWHYSRYWYITALTKHLGYLRDLGLYGQAAQMFENYATEIKDYMVELSKDKKQVGLYGLFCYRMAWFYFNTGLKHDAIILGEQALKSLLEAYGFDDITIGAGVDLMDYYFDLGYWQDAQAIGLYLWKNLKETGKENTNRNIVEIFYILSQCQNDKQKEFELLAYAYKASIDCVGEAHNKTLELKFKVGQSYASLGHESDGFYYMISAIDSLHSIYKGYETLYLERQYYDYLLKYGLYNSIISKEYDYSISFNSKRPLEDLLTSLVWLTQAYVYSDLSSSIYLAGIYETDRLQKLVGQNIHLNYLLNEQSKMLNSTSYYKWHQKVLPQLAYYKANDSINCYLYNSRLQNNSMQANYEIEFRQKLLQSDDSIQKKYRRYIFEKSIAQKLNEDFDDENKISQIRSLQYEIKELEMELLKYYQDNHSAKSEIQWSQIRDALGSNEIAIEFVEFPDTTGSLNYFALTIKNDSKSPNLVPLFTIGDLGNAHNDSTFYHLIWKPLGGYLTGVNKIYFSASGRLNYLPIENLSMPEGRIMSDKYELYRLSSTAEILSIQRKRKYHSAALFGGIDYEVSNYQIAKSITENSLFTQKSFVSRSLPDSLMTRGGFDNLVESLSEVISIKGCLDNGNVYVKLYTDSAGTEKSLKDLSSQEINIMHFATHGMYMYPEEAEQRRSANNFKFISTREADTHYTTEDKALTRSFLVMAGGNKLLRRDIVLDEEDDGVLTALEISLLDFRNLDLVVLSACQSGLGDTSVDGVVGLQRGFKKAGANTILMSLDKVDDEATRILMVEFYKNLMDGKTKLQSLKNAQNHLRQVENGKYDKPEYWASFIMLDGLN